MRDGRPGPTRAAVRVPGHLLAQAAGTLLGRAGVTAALGALPGPVPGTSVAVSVNV